MKSTLLSILAIVALGYLGLCLFLYFMQRSMMYFPTPATNAPGAEAMSIESGDATLRVWRLHGDQPDAILYFGGNAEDVAQNVPEFDEWFSEFAVYLVNYRGYGGSSGKPTEANLYQDAEVVLDVIRNRHENVGVLGRSLGCGVATHLATVREIDRLALVSPPASFTALAREMYPMVPTGWLLKDRYDSLARADRISAPTMILIAENDRTVPPSHSKRLANALGEQLARLHVIENTDHNSIGGSSGYRSALVRFFDELGHDRTTSTSRR